MSSNGDETFEFILYRYNPSLPAAIIFVFLFALSALHHLYKLILTRTWYFIPLALGAIAETSGYSARAVSHFDKEDLPPYLVQSITIVIAPALFCASIYMVLGRLVRVLRAEDMFLIRVRWLTKIFVVGDIISFLAQGSGSGVMSSGSLESMRTGEKIVIGGVFFQVLVFGFFLIVCVHFHRKLLRHPTLESERSAQKPHNRNWKTLMKCIYISGALIIVRSVFRGIEFVYGNDGYLMKNEAWLYVFDSLLMICAIGLFNWCHPSGIVTRDEKHENDRSDSEQGIRLGSGRG